MDGDKIHLPPPVTFAHLKKQRYWTPRNAVLLPPFLTEAAILHGESDAGELLKIFSRSITEWAKEGENSSKADDDNDEDSVITIEAEDKKMAKPGKEKQATAKTLTTIADDCGDVLVFLQAVAVKSPRVIAAPLSPCANKRARVWFLCWTDANLPTPPKPDPQDHMGLTGFLTNMATRFHTVEALRPVVAAQREAENETKGWDSLPPMTQRVILAASAATGTSILTSPPPTIHRFLNARNATALQADFSLTYAGNNIYLPTSFWQALLQGHILAILEPDTPTGLSHILIPPSSAGPANAQHRAMQIQVLLSMGQDHLSKEEAGELLDQRFHVLTSTQELCHSMRNFVKIAGDYLREKSPICLSMATWLRHTDRFERQYDKAFARDPLFRADFMDRIHKRVQVFLHSCNTTDIEDVGSGALAEFGGIQKKVERGEWFTSTPVRVDRPAQNLDGRRKSDGHGMGESPSGGGGGRDAVFNHGVDPQLRNMDRLGDMMGATRFGEPPHPLDDGW